MKTGDRYAYVKLGINYEDGGGSDSDHNDAAACLKGVFKVNHSSGEIISLRDQTIRLDTKRDAGLSQNIRIEATDVWGNRRSLFQHYFSSNGELSDWITINKGERLEVFFTTQNRATLSAPHAQVKLERDICR